MPNADSKNKNIRQIRQIMPVIGLNAFTIIKKTNIIDAKIMPIIHANFFCLAPTYSGFCLLTIKRPIIKVGEYFGLTKTRIIKSVKKKVTTYFMSRKFCLKRTSMRDIKTNKNNIPADARISRSLRTGMLYPLTSSPNFIILFILFFFSCLLSTTH